MADTLTPEGAADSLCELSADVRAAVLLDAAGSLAGAGGDVGDDARALGELARQLFEEVDRATRDWDTEPPEQVEVQVPGGTVFASRTPRWTLAAVAKRAALSSLMLFDLKAVLGELEGGPPIRRSRPADEGTAGPGAGGVHRGGASDAGAGRVKEKRKGPISRAAGLAEGVAATVRRMQREREPRVLAYDPTGYARLVQPEARGHERIMEIAEQMVARVEERES